MTFLFFAAFISGILTVLAPCVLPLLPVIFSVQKREHPLAVPVFFGLLAFSLLCVTFLFNRVFSFWNISEIFLRNLSIVIILFVGIFTIFPQFGGKLSLFVKNFFGIGKVLHIAQTQKGLLSAALLGLALGPVFSTCSPSFAVIIALILPVETSLAVLLILTYIFGFIFFLAAIYFFGNIVLSKIFKIGKIKYLRYYIGIFLILFSLFLFFGIEEKIGKFLNQSPLSRVTQEDEKLSLALKENFLQEEKTHSQCDEHSGCSDENANSGLLGAHVLFDEETLDEQGFDLPNILEKSEYISGKELGSSQNGITLYEFWSIHCATCKTSLQILGELSRKFSEEKISFIAIHSGENENNSLRKDILQYTQELRDFENFSFLYDADYSAWNLLHNSYWPSLYLVDASGKVRYFSYGFPDETKLKDAISQLLAE